MKDCKYPNCYECDLEDCEMELKDIQAMLKRRRYAFNPELYRQKQRDYIRRTKEKLPYCDDCEFCVLVEKEKQDGYRRLCVSKMRLIEQKVANSPQWCEKRTPSSEYLKRKERMLKQKKEAYRNKTERNKAYESREDVILND